MPKQHALDVSECQRLAQQRIVIQIDLSDGQIVGGAPIGVHPPQQFLIDGLGLHR
jgi:hypothetical protein